MPGRSAGWGTLVQLTVAFEVPHNVRFGYLKECPAIGQIGGGRAPVPGRLADGGGAATSCATASWRLRTAEAGNNEHQMVHACGMIGGAF